MCNKVNFKHLVTHFYATVAYKKFWKIEESSSNTDFTVSLYGVPIWTLRTSV